MTHRYIIWLHVFEQKDFQSDVDCDGSQIHVMLHFIILENSLRVLSSLV